MPANGVNFRDKWKLHGESRGKNIKCKKVGVKSKLKFKIGEKRQ